ncbi:MAG: hypothetical protein HY397_00510 [Candidatus Doudnabacteria bacterium]|nr:hypothetical protein [Candidatus Doudnabacteria bacterium]
MAQAGEAQKLESFVWLLGHQLVLFHYYFIARHCRKVAEPELEAGEKIEIAEVGFEEFIKKMSHNYWGGEFTADILRLRLEPKKLEEFKKKMFSK